LHKITQALPQSCGAGADAFLCETQVVVCVARDLVSNSVELLLPRATQG